MKDTIYRQEAIDAINHICPVDTEYDCTLLDRVDVRCVLSDLPSAQPERKRGKWIDYVNSHCECSVCHTEWSYFSNETECFEFCPNCGADMRGEQDNSISN